MPHDPLIIKAIKDRNIDSLCFIQNADFSARDEQGNNYLHIAVKHFMQDGAPCGTEVIDWLLVAGISANDKNNQLLMPFQCGNINARDGEYQRTQLSHAIRGNNIALFNALLSAKVDPNKKSADGCPPLTDCTTYGRFEMLTALLNVGAIPLVNMSKKDKFNPLLTAIYKNSLKSEPQIIQCVNLLLDNDAGIIFSNWEYKLKDIDFSNKVMLCVASGDKSLNAESILIQNYPTLLKAITSVDDLKQARISGRISQEKLEKIYLACIFIASDLSNNPNSDEKERDVIENIIIKMEKIWPKLKNEKNTLYEKIQQLGLFKLTLPKDPPSSDPKTRDKPDSGCSIS